MKALKIVGTLAAIGGAYILLSSDERKQEKSQEDNTPSTNSTTQLPANIAASKINETNIKQENLVDPLPAEINSFIMTPINDKLLTNIAKDLPSAPETQPSNATAVKPTPINLVNQLPAQPGSFVMTPIDDFIIDVSKDLPISPEHQSINHALGLLKDLPSSIVALPITQDKDLLKFKAIESKEGGVVPIIIHSVLLEKPQTEDDLIVLFTETKEQARLPNFTHERNQRLKEKNLSLLVAIFLPKQTSEDVFLSISNFVGLMNELYEVKTTVLQ